MPTGISRFTLTKPCAAERPPPIARSPYLRLCADWSPAISGYASNFQPSLQAPWWSTGRKKEDKQANKQKAKQNNQTKIMNGERTKPGVSLGGPWLLPFPSRKPIFLSPQYSWLRWSLFTGYGWQFNFSRVWRPVSVLLLSSPTLRISSSSGSDF